MEIRRLRLVRWSSVVDLVRRRRSAATALSGRSEYGDVSFVEKYVRRVKDGEGRVVVEVRVEGRKNFREGELGFELRILDVYFIYFGEVGG